MLAIIIREGDGTPLQYSCLENPMDGGIWWAAVRKNYFTIFILKEETEDSRAEP